MRLFSFLVLVSYFFHVGCTGISTNKEKTIHMIGTKSYDKKVSQFKYSPNEAKDILNKYLEKKNEHVLKNVHKIIINDEYLFSFPEKLPRVPLEGYYVNGFTGVIEKKSLSIDGKVYFNYGRF